MSKLAYVYTRAFLFEVHIFLWITLCINHIKVQPRDKKIVDKSAALQGEPRLRAGG